MTGKEYNNQFTQDELSSEVWKNISGYDGVYQISTLGRVRSITREVTYIEYGKQRKKRIWGQILIPTLNKRHKRMFKGFWKNAEAKQFYIHRLVLSEFVGPCPAGMEGCHNDGNAFNNRVENLRWDTCKNNHNDKKKHGTVLYGERNHASKLTDKDVLNIRILGNHLK